jgi:hypothetical protein
MEKRSTTKLAKGTMNSGLAIAVLPLVLWGFSSLGCENPLSEGTCAGATALWGLILSVPLGVIVFLVGLFAWFVSRFPISK